MKISLKNKSSVITASILVAAFLLLHFYVYLQVSPLDDSAQGVPIIQSYTDTPAEVQKLSLCEEKRPTYLNPFRKITYSYQEKIGDTYGECTII